METLMPKIITKSFFHRGLWYRYKYNRTNMENILKEYNSFLLENLTTFLDEVVFNWAPDELFNSEDSLRVTGIMTEEEYPTKVNPSRFKKWVNMGLMKEGGTRHNNVLTTILEHDPNSLATEVPVWCRCFPYRNKWLNVAGHIDLLQFNDGEIYIWDYKPDRSKTVGDQVSLYKQLLVRLIMGLDEKIVKCGWFDEFSEHIIIGSDRTKVEKKE